MFSPPAYVCVPPPCPSVSVPVFTGVNKFVTVPPVPVELTFTTVAGTLKVVTFTAPVNAAVPPIFCNCNVPTPITLVPFTSAPATPRPVCKVRLNPPPVTAPSVMSPAVVVAFVFRKVSLASVTAPSVSAVFVVFSVPHTVTRPPTAVVFRPPVKFCVPPVCPSVSVPVFAGANAFVIVPPVPVELTFTTVAGTLKVIAFTAPVKDAVPPMFCNCNVPTPVTLVPFTSAPAAGLPVCSVRLNPPPVTAPSVTSPAVVVALLFSIESPASVTAPKVSAVFVVFTVPFTVTKPPTAVVFSPPANVNVSPPPTPSVSAPVFVKFTAFVTVFVVPWNVTAKRFAAVVRLVSAVFPVNVIEPPV